MWPAEGGTKCIICLPPGLVPVLGPSWASGETGFHPEVSQQQQSKKERGGK